MFLYECQNSCISDKKVDFLKKYVILNYHMYVILGGYIQCEYYL